MENCESKIYSQILSTFALNTLVKLKLVNSKQNDRGVSELSWVSSQQKSFLGIIGNKTKEEK